MVKYDEVDGGRSGVFDKPSKTRIVIKKVEKLSKVEKPQRPKKLQRSLIRRNFYQSSNPSSIGNEKLELPLEL